MTQNLFQGGIVRIHLDWPLFITIEYKDSVVFHVSAPFGVKRFWRMIVGKWSWRSK